MNKTLQRIGAFTLGGISLLILGAFSYLVFVFPKTIAVWKEQARELTAGEQLAVSVSVLCQQFGLVVFTFLLLVVVACTVWAAVAIRGREQTGPTIR